MEPIPVALPVGPQDPVEEPYWQGLLEGELRIQQCAACDRWIWAPSYICPQCHTFDPVWRPVRPEGVVYSWTTTNHVFPASREFDGHTPYTIALVALPEAGGRRLLGIVADDGPVRAGTPVRAWIQPASELTGGWAVLRWVHAEDVEARS